MSAGGGTRAVVAGVGLTLLTGYGVWDGIGTLAIGVLLVAVAVVLAIETKSLLIGESATADQVAAIEAAIAGGTGVSRLIHLRTVHLGPEELLVVIRADSGAPYSAVRNLLEAARLAGAQRLAIATRQKIEAAP